MTEILGVTVLKVTPLKIRSLFVILNLRLKASSCGTYDYNIVEYMFMYVNIYLAHTYTHI